MRKFKAQYFRRINLILGCIAALFAILFCAGVAENPFEVLLNLGAGSGVAMAFAATAIEVTKDTTFKDWLKAKEISEDNFKEMEADKQAELYNEFNSELRKAIAKAIDDGATKEEVESLKTELRDHMDKQMTQLNTALKEQGIAIKKLLTRDDGGGKQLSFKDSVKELLTKNKDKLSVLKNGSKSEASNNQFEIEIKAAADMTSANISGGNVPVEDRIEGLNVVPTRRVRLLDIMAQRGTSSNIVSWVYQANKDGSAGQTGEGLEKNQIDFDLVVANESVKKTTAYIKVTTEMIDDIDWITSEINNELMKELMKAVESEAYSGDGTGENLNGVRTVATAFGPGSAWTGKVDNANEIDVLTAAFDQIENAEHELEQPYILMHPTDVNKLKVAKVSASDKRYVERLIMIGSSLLFDGSIPIIKSTLVTQDEYLAGDFSKAILVSKENVRMDIGLDGNDFTKNFRTILAEWRGLVIVKNNDRTAFIKGDFTTDKAALETA